MPTLGILAHLLRMVSWNLNIMRFVSVISHPLLIIWEYDDWCLGPILNNMFLFVSADRLQNNDAWRCSWTLPGYVQDLCVDIVPSTAKPCTVRLGLPKKHENSRPWKSNDYFLSGFFVKTIVLVLVRVLLPRKPGKGSFLGSLTSRDQW